MRGHHFANRSNQYRLQTKRCKRYFHMSGEMVPPQYSPSNAVRSLAAHDRAKCPRRRARSFDEGVTKSRGKRGSARHFLFRTTFGVWLSSRLGQLVCALLRFRERPRTIEVQRTTSSPQNHRKSLTQYSVVLFIQSGLCQLNHAIDYKSIYADSVDPKITHRIKTRAFACKLCAFFILAIFGFAAWRQQSCDGVDLYAY